MPTTLIVPGLRDHVAQHWQTLLAASDPAIRGVPPMGSELVDLGEVGHLNPASGYGEWPQALDFIARLSAAH